MECSAGDRFVNVEVAVPDLDVESAIGVGARPSLEVNGRALAAEIGKGYKVPVLALAALGERHHQGLTPCLAWT